MFNNEFSSGISEIKYKFYFSSYFKTHLPIREMFDSFSYSIRRSPNLLKVTKSFFPH